MKGKVKQAIQLWNHLGPRWMAYRTGYALRQKMGAVERGLPVSTWEAEYSTIADGKQGFLALARLWLSSPPPFFFAWADRARFQELTSAWDADAAPASAAASVAASAAASSPVVGEADDLLAGRLTYFSAQQLETGFPPQWHRDPASGSVWPRDLHWSCFSEFEFGDIKQVWETSRFTFAYTLVRAYWRSGDERYAEAFWQLIDDWRTSNPPQAGPAWKCGQETSLRVMAWCFGLYGFMTSPSTTPERVAELIQMIAISGKRVDYNFRYALSQRNNHSVSEAMGLWTIGTLFPQLEDAARWQEKGRRHLEHLARALIYDDGSYIQHSMNYHRFVLDVFAWVIRLARLNGAPFSQVMVDRVLLSAQFLQQLQEPANGRVPNYGSNDGALVLPLTNCDYRDYRPVLQAVFAVGAEKRIYGDGPWDEEAWWLSGGASSSAPVQPPEPRVLGESIGGYYLLRGEESHALVRCAAFRDRPSQADLLHFDLWWKGENIALDPGTYRYNALPPWEHALGSTDVHNTVTVDDRDQMDRFGRFLWLPWAKGTTREFVRQANGLLYWEGSHDGYQRLADPVAHRRAVLLLPTDPEIWIVADELTGDASHRLRQHWLLDDFAHDWDEESRLLALSTGQGDYFLHFPATIAGEVCSIVRADAGSTRGWQSPYYAMRLPALSVERLAVTNARDQDGASATLFITCFSAQRLRSEYVDHVLTIHAERASASIHFSPGASALVKEALLNRESLLIHSSSQESRT